MLKNQSKSTEVYDELKKQRKSPEIYENRCDAWLLIHDVLATGKATYVRVNNVLSRIKNMPSTRGPLPVYYKLIESLHSALNKNTQEPQPVPENVLEILQKAYMEAEKLDNNILEQQDAILEKLGDVFTQQTLSQQPTLTQAETLIALQNELIELKKNACTKVVLINSPKSPQKNDSGQKRDSENNEENNINANRTPVLTTKKLRITTIG